MTPQRLTRIARSGASGAAGSIVDFAAMIALVELCALAYAPAAAAASAAGAIACFALNRRFAFRDVRPVTRRQLAAAIVVALGAMAINAFVVHVLAAVLRVAYLAAKLASAAVVFLTWTYPTQSRFVFATTRS